MLEDKTDEMGLANSPSLLNVILKRLLFEKDSEIVALSYDRGCELADPLWPGEADCIVGAVPRRQREFVSARSAARRAMGELRLPLASIGRSKNGAPIWPDGVVGSLSHGAGDSIAVVASRSKVMTLGVDIEAATPLSEDIVDNIVMPEDWAGCLDLRSHHSTIWQMVIFSAKEAFYKAYHQLTIELVDFDAVSLRFNSDDSRLAGDFRVVARGDLLNCPDILQKLSGRWLVYDGKIFTAMIARV